jgi:MoaA/NifB/PqqE/SkfB family radical SAM enzyme
MTMEQFRQILGRHPRATAIGLTGGEPLAHPQLFEMINLAHKRCLKVHIPSNGTLIAKNLEALFKAPVELLNVSMYGTDAQSFSQATGADGSLFNTVLDGVAELARRRRPGGYPRILRTSFIFTRNNLDQIIDFIRLSEKIRVDQVKLKSLRVYGIPGFEESMCLHRDHPEVQKFIETLRRERFRIPVYLPRFHRLNDMGGCDMPFRLLSIDGDGYIGPCCVEGTSKRWDNFFDHPDVWNGPTMTRVRRIMIDQASPLPPFCLSCEERVRERLTLKD